LLREAAGPEIGPEPLALRGATLPGRPGRWTIRCREGRIASVEPEGGAPRGRVIEVGGGLVIPGLHDPHLHLLSLARERESLILPPEIRGWDAIAALAKRRASELPEGRWLRIRRFDPWLMTGGQVPDRAALDAIASDRPVRLQHRNLRLDVLNTTALHRCGLDEPTGQLHQLGSLISDPSDHPSPMELRELVGAASADLLAHGVTSIGDAGAHNGDAELGLLAALAEEDVVRQRLWTMVSGLKLRDGEVGEFDPARVRHAKLEAVEARLDLDGMLEAGAAARRAGLGVAVHATSPAEIAAALAVIESLPPGPVPDRIEHASVAPPETVAAVAASGAAVVANPALVLEGGDQYRAEFDPDELPDLHRLASWTAAGVPLALASDAPVTVATGIPMLAAAIDLRTATGADFVPTERLSPQAALEAATIAPAALVGAKNLGRASPAPPVGAQGLGRIAPGAPADLVVLDAPDLLTASVTHTLVAGRVAHG
jgi:predicted amidohydrolase YtcJ